MTPISIFLKASILISAATLIHAVWGGRMSAAARHLMWTFTIGGLLLLPALSFIVPSCAAGYDRLSLDALIQLRAHGVDAEYARDLGALGYAKLSLDGLVQLRNHGVDPDYIRELAALGYVRMRNSGIGPSQVRSANSRARRQLSVDELVSLASRGWK